MLAAAVWFPAADYRETPDPVASPRAKKGGVLRFNGGTALLGKFHTFPLTDRDILFNGTTFKPLADADDFFLARPCRQRETIAVGAGGLVFDTSAIAYTNLLFFLLPKSLS